MQTDFQVIWVGSRLHSRKHQDKGMVLIQREPSPVVLLDITYYDVAVSTIALTHFLDKLFDSMIKHWWHI